MPYDRNKYGNDLKNVLNSYASGSLIDVPNQGSKESVILAIFHAMVFVFANVWNIYYIINWYKYVNDDAVFLLCVQIILDLGWLIVAIVYFRQRNSEKYRDDVELDFSKKERSGIERGISDYSELSDKFVTSDGRSQIYVKISNDKVYVLLENPLLLDHGYQPSYEAGER